MDDTMDAPTIGPVNLIPKDWTDFVIPDDCGAPWVDREGRVWLRGTEVTPFVYLEVEDDG